MKNILLTNEIVEWLKSNRDGEAEWIDVGIDYIEKNIGDPFECERSLGVYAHSQAVFDYYINSDLQAFRQWLYVAAKIEAHQLPSSCRYGYPTLRFWKPLLSNHAGMIAHVATFPEQYPLDAGKDLSWVLETREKPLHDNHQRWIRQLAIRGEWDAVRAQTALALANPPKSVKPYVLIDMRYLQALADGDMPMMRECLAELLKPRIRKARNDLPLLGELLSLDVLVLAKIAWLHGYEIDPQSDYVPRDWLSMTPNSVYTDPWDFMKNIVLP